MHKKFVPAISIVLGLGIIGTFVFFLSGNNIVVLNPQGSIAEQERSLMLVTLFLMLIVVVPVFVLTFVFAWKYREGNKKAAYTPEWDGDTRLEALWWGVPLAITAVLAGVIWTSSHELDPHKPIDHANRPINIQVVALQWKWLFIYPEQGIATVNYVQFPEDTPVNFQLTSDAPMNSFWIPELGGQIYAMAGMSTRLHLIADKTGQFRGSSANISGEGFAGMTFTAHSTNQADFKSWVTSVGQTPDKLTMDTYNVLARPSKENPIAFYSLPEQTSFQNTYDLYDTIVMKYSGGQNHGGHGTTSGNNHSNEGR